MCSRAGVTMSATGRVENGAKRVDVTMLMLDRLRSNHEKELASLRREHAQHVADVLDVVHTKLAAVRQELVAARQEALAARELAARTCQQQQQQEPELCVSEADLGQPEQRKQPTPPTPPPQKKKRKIKHQEESSTDPSWSGTSQPKGKGKAKATREEEEVLPPAPTRKEFIELYNLSDEAFAANKAVQDARFKVSKSGYRGVYEENSGLKTKWRAMGCREVGQPSLGTFADKEEAARVYDRHALHVRGPDANLNFHPKNYLTPEGTLLPEHHVPANARRRLHIGLFLLG